jgi:hypothetical protein
MMLCAKAERDRMAYAHHHYEKILRKSLEESIQAISDTVEKRGGECISATIRYRQESQPS